VRNCRGESCIRPRGRATRAITRIALTVSSKGARYFLLNLLPPPCIEKRTGGLRHIREETGMDKQKDQDTKKETAEKPEYIKPEIIATYSRQKLEKEFAHTYGNSFVDLFG
jgi:hypothetical protein